MNFEKFTIKAQQAIGDAQQLVLHYGQQQLEPEHLLKALLQDSEGVVPAVLKKVDVNVGDLDRQLTLAIEKNPRVSGAATGNIYASAAFNQVLNQAITEAKNLRDEFVSTEHVLLAMLSIKNTEVYRLLSSFGVTKEKILLVFTRCARETASHGSKSGGQISCSGTLCQGFD